MQQLAVPEGVLESGGSVDGRLFFEKVTDDVERVTTGFRLTDFRYG